MVSALFLEGVKCEPRLIPSRALFSLMVVVLLAASGCSPSLKLVRSNFHSYEGLSAELSGLQATYPRVISVRSIGETHEGKSLFAVKVAADAAARKGEPALLAIFALHSDEHVVTDVAVGIIKHLAENYGKDGRVTHLLDRHEVWFIPMMNPDGVEYDLSGAVRPFSWRKNRRPTGEATRGVDLNRNWGRPWTASISGDLIRELRDRNSEVYAGEEAFSERETRAARDFLLAHRNVRMVVDYHSGYAGFIQGGVGFPIPPPEAGGLDPELRGMYERIAERFARKASDPDDARTPFVVNKDRDVAAALKRHAPWYVRPFIPRRLPLPPGTLGEWVNGELGIMAFGVEMFRDGGFFEDLPASKERLIRNQTRGFLSLLEALSGVSPGRPR